MEPIKGKADIQAGQATMKATAQIRANFATPHLKSAVYSARNVMRIEIENKASEFGSFFEEIGTNCISCIWFCVASLESYANEIFLTSKEVFPEYENHFIEVIHDSIDRRELLDKLGTILKLKKHPGIRKGEEPWQSLGHMVAVRNALVHFRPEWSHELDDHAKLNAKLKTKIKINKYYQSGVEIFPHAYFSESFCRWCIETSFSVIDLMEENVKYLTKWVSYKQNLIEKLNAAVV